MRKRRTTPKVKRHLRRLMRRTTRHVTERTLHERDLLVYRREECSNIRFAQIANACGGHELVF
jgi:RNase P protein component